MIDAELFPKPPVWSVAVTLSGARIAVWPDESGDPGCFTGELLNGSGGIGDVSCMWDCAKVSRIEPLTANDRALSSILVPDPEPSTPLTDSPQEAG